VVPVTASGPQVVYTASNTQAYHNSPPASPPVPPPPVPAAQVPPPAPPPMPAAASGLPPNWTECLTDDGQHRFYFNSQTQASSWTVPTA
jgi:hypothetical protein